MKKSEGRILVSRIETRQAEKFDMTVLEEYSSTCPWCGQVLLRTLPFGVIVHEREKWLRDGDILNILSSLTKEQKKHDAYDFRWFVGDCPSCKESYYVVEAMFIDAESTDELESFLCWNCPMENVANYVCTFANGDESLPKEWRLGEYRTPAGPMHAHRFGPFRLDSPDDPPDFDSSKHGESLVLSLFNDLRTLVQNSRERWENEELDDLIRDFEEYETENPVEHIDPAPLYFAGPDAEASINRDRSNSIYGFFRSVKKVLGTNPSGRIWPYRHERSMFLACDLKGDRGEVNMTIYESGTESPFIPVLSKEDTEVWECEPTVTDTVDAFYLVYSLTRVLGIRLFQSRPGRALPAISPGDKA